MPVNGCRTPFDPYVKDKSTQDTEKDLPIHFPFSPCSPCLRGKNFLARIGSPRNKRRGRVGKICQSALFPRIGTREAIFHQNQMPRWSLKCGKPTPNETRKTGKAMNSVCRTSNGISGCSKPGGSRPGLAERTSMSAQIFCPPLKRGVN